MPNRVVRNAGLRKVERNDIVLAVQNIEIFQLRSIALTTRTIYIEWIEEYQLLRFWFSYDISTLCK